ncbi:MAG: MarC family protein [Candidatus Zixiibacteriota bacterium]
MEFLSVALTLFLIMDPFGNIPLFIPILEKVRPERRRKVLIRELFLALAVIAVFILSGKYLMGLLGLRQESVAIAGGIILFLISIKMVFPKHDTEIRQDMEEEPLLVPMAVPLIAGPSMLAVLLLFSSAGNPPLMELLLAALLAWGGTFVVLVLSTYLYKFFAKRGLIAMERLMGMILVVLAVQLFLDGVTTYLK